MNITIKSFNGIGDLLFVTPTLRVIKTAYPNSKIIVNTNYPELLKNNPFTDSIGTKDEGVFLGYDDPIHAKHPDKHHIYTDWQIVCSAYNLVTPIPNLKPEIYLDSGWEQQGRRNIGVQINHHRHWHSKKVWPHFHTMCDLYPRIIYTRLEPIPQFSSVIELVKHIASLELVICAEGGISHIARAVGTPAIVIYGGFARPEWNGYEDHDNICNYPPCGPCYNPRPCEGEYDRECFSIITPSYVAGRAEKILSMIGDN